MALSDGAGQAATVLPCFPWVPPKAATEQAGPLGAEKNCSSSTAPSPAREPAQLSLLFFSLQLHVCTPGGSEGLNRSWVLTMKPGALGENRMPGGRDLTRPSQLGDLQRSQEKGHSCLSAHSLHAGSDPAPGMFTCHALSAFPVPTGQNPSFLRHLTPHRRNTSSGASSQHCHCRPLRLLLLLPAPSLPVSKRVTSCISLLRLP